MLRSAYSDYIDIRQCREARVSLGLYVSDLEIERAKYAVRRIEQAVKPHLDPATLDNLWSRVEATKRNRVVYSITDNTCTWRSEHLLKRLRDEVPDSGPIVKDF